LISYKGKTIGIIGCNSPPQSVKSVDDFFLINTENRSEKLKKIMNNNVFRIVKNEPNLATKILRVFRKRIVKDYKKKFGERLLGLITFVEPPREGVCYKADNWDFLGKTKGFSCKRRGAEGEWITKQWEKTGVKKMIFAKCLHRSVKK